MRIFCIHFVVTRGYKMTIDQKQDERNSDELSVKNLLSVLRDARDDVASQADRYQQLLPLKKHRYEAQMDKLKEIDALLEKAKSLGLI